MTALLWLIPLALTLGGLGLMGFLWALRSGQFDDLDGAAHRILFDDDAPPAPRATPLSAISAMPPGATAGDDPKDAAPPSRSHALPCPANGVNTSDQDPTRAARDPVAAGGNRCGPNAESRHEL